MVYVVGVAAAVCLGLGYVLQQRAAALAPIELVLSWRLLTDLLRKRTWLFGVGSMVAGQLLGGLALQMASVALVEPLLSANLLFLSDRSVRWHEVGGAVLLSLALGAFLLVGNPRSSNDPHPARIWTGVALVAVAAAVIVLVVVARNQHLVRETILLSVAAGLLYGLQDAATRQSLQRAGHGVVQMFYTPWTYLVVVAAVIGLLLAQSAFKTGSLSHSLPPLTAAEPLAGIGLGVGLLADRVAVTPGRLAVEAACGAAVILGVYLIGTSRTLNRPHGERSPQA